MVISRVISHVIWVITIVTLLIIPLITAHEPPSMVWFRGLVAHFGFKGLGV